VRQVTILFTDLKGSTQMYATQGDAPSYATVRGHFEQLTQILEKHDGAIIKTIGDAVMAAFHDPAKAMQAALEIQKEVAPLIVKLGLHTGPALAVTANGQLDYFGQTVNVASRIQAQSHGADIVLSDDLIAFVPDTIPRQSFTAQLKGTEAPITLWRLSPMVK
jgi:class 3 adenylate cyclase